MCYMTALTVREHFDVCPQASGRLRKRLLRFDRSFHRALYMRPDNLASLVYASYTSLKRNDCPCFRVSGRV